jgi:hypothetical protein
MADRVKDNPAAALRPNLGYHAGKEPPGDFCMIVISP